MKYMRPILALLFVILSVAPSAARELSLAEISAYLNSIGRAETDFTQINDDGTISTGRLMIWRPGRIRFEYLTPEKSLVLASKGKVAIFDTRSNERPQMFQLANTPLALILRPNIDLENSKVVVDHHYDGTATTVTAQDPKHPDYGNIKLVFTSDPIELRQWVTTDSSGQQTTVILGPLKERRSMLLDTFDIARELKARGF